MDSRRKGIWDPDNSDVRRISRDATLGSLAALVILALGTMLSTALPGKPSTNGYLTLLALTVGLFMAAMILRRRPERRGVAGGLILGTIVFGFFGMIAVSCIADYEEQSNRRVGGDVRRTQCV